MLINSEVCVCVWCSVCEVLMYNFENRQSKLILKNTVFEHLCYERKNGSYQADSSSRDGVVGVWGMRRRSSLGRHPGEGDLTVGGRELRTGCPLGVFGGEISASDGHQDDLDGVGFSQGLVDVDEDGVELQGPGGRGVPVVSLAARASGVLALEVGCVGVGLLLDDLQGGGVGNFDFEGAQAIGDAVGQVGQVCSREPVTLSGLPFLFVAGEEVRQLAKGGDITVAAGVLGGRRGCLAAQGPWWWRGWRRRRCIHLDLGFISRDGGWGWLGLWRRLGSVPTEPGASAVAVLVAQVAVILRWDTCYAFVNAYGAPVLPATLGTDRWSLAGAGWVAEALAVVTLFARRRWRRGGGPGTFARLGIGLAGVQGTPAPLAAPRGRPAVFPCSLFGCRGRWGRTLVFRGRGRWGRRLVLFRGCFLLGRRLLGGLGLVLASIPMAGLRLLHCRYNAPHKGKLIQAQQVLNPSMALRGQVIPEGLAVRSGEAHGGLARPEVQREGRSEPFVTPHIWGTAEMSTESAPHIWGAGEISTENRDAYMWHWAMMS